MQYLELVVLLLVGLFGAGGLIGCGSIVATLAPIKGIVGIAALVFGILGILDLGSVGANLASVIMIATIVAEIGLGFIFGTALIKQLTGSGVFDGLVSKLKAFEIILGIVAIVAAVYFILVIAKVL